MRLAAVHTYPVKGCHRLDHDGARVEPWGLAGDRRWLVVDADGLGITQREATALVGLRAAPRDGGLVLRAAGRPDLDVAEPTGVEPLPVRVFRNRLLVPALPAGPAADDWLTALLGRPARLVHLARPTRHLAPGARAYDTGDRVSFADQYPLLLATTGSLDALNGWLAEAGEAPVPISRFRPNLVVEGAPPGPRTTGPADPCGSAPPGSAPPARAAAAWSPPPTRRRGYAERSRCAPSGGTAPSTGSSPSACTWSPTARAWCGSATR